MDNFNQNSNSNQFNKQQGNNFQAQEVSHKKANIDVDEELERLIAAHKTRIKVIGCGGGGNNTINRINEVGIKGVKIDFINRESQDLLEFYEDCLRKGARYKVMVNFHGANKPAGEARTWPHEMTREGIHGLEQNKWSAMPSSHYTILPFTRMLAGHGDFTPTTFQKKFQKGTTSTLQLATAVLYTSSILCWADKPEIYLKSSALDYIKTMPCVWDETRVLKGSSIGGVAAFARRSGSTWYVVVLNGNETKSDYIVDLSFLKTGSWAGSLVEDDMSDTTNMKHSEKVLHASDTLDVTMHPGGGFLLRLEAE